MGSFVGYVRVSKVQGRAGDSFQSPRQQEDTVRTWAKAHGHELVDLVHELDVSGSRAVKDRELDRLVRRIEAGEAEGLIVARLDRFARSLVGGLAAIERIERAGGSFVAVQDGFDLSTPTGRLVLRIMLSLAEFELDRIRSTFAASKRDAVKRGLAVSSAAPFGYGRPGGGRPLEVVEDEARYVREIFHRRARGDGWAQIGRWLEGEKVSTRYGSERWANRALRELVQNRAYLGEVRVVLSRATGETITTEGAHEAIVDAGLWAAANAVAGPSFTGQTDNPGVERSLLRGLLRCAGCRGTMRWERRRRVDGETYWLTSCRAGQGDSANVCPDRARLSDLEDAEQAVAAVVLQTLAQQARAAAESARDAGRAEQAALDRARATRDAFRDDIGVQEALGMTQYVEGLRARQDAVDVAERALEVAAPALRVRALHHNLPRRWPDLDDVARQQALANLLQCVFVRGSGPHWSRRPVGERIHLVWRGDDVDLPTRGRRVGGAVGPFRWDGDRDA